MLEQEMASIIKFTLDTAGNPSPYYWEVPQHFSIPAAYYPTPEIVTGGETFLTYNMDYTWFIKFFHRSSQAAYALAFPILTAIRENRNLIPLITETGERAEGNVRVKDPTIKVLDNGAAQLTIEWRSRRPYKDDGAGKMQTYEVGNWNKAELYMEKTISDAYAEALERYAVPVTQQKNGGDPENP